MNICKQKCKICGKELESRTPKGLETALRNHKRKHVKPI